jgi:hypothetical protein
MKPTRSLHRFVAHLDALPMTRRNRLRLRYDDLGTPLGRGERAFALWAFFTLDVRPN